MAPLCINMLLFAITGLGTAHGVAISMEAGGASSVMRRETTHARLSPTGETLLLQDYGRSSDPGRTSCDYVFFNGEERTNNCTGTAGGSRIMSPAMCIEAAGARGITTVPTGSISPFEISSTHFNDHPIGCFWTNCSESTDGKGCYWYNGIVQDPPLANLSGTPICKRAAYLNGKKDDNGGCPAEYNVIVEEHHCELMGKCMGYCEGREFRANIHNMSKYHDFPKGCFIHNIEESTVRKRKLAASSSENSTNSSSGFLESEADAKPSGALKKCIYFNGALPTDVGLPKNPKGTPVCFLKQE